MRLINNTLHNSTRNLLNVFSFEGNGSCQKELAYESLIDGDITPAIEHIRSLCHQEFTTLNLSINSPKSIFRFSGFKIITDDGVDEENRAKQFDKDVLLNDIRQGAITFANPYNFNDPMDPIIKVWGKIREDNAKGKEKKYYDLLNKVLKQYLRIACFSNDKKAFLNPLMWAYYANNQTGICIEYFIESGDISKHNSNDLYMGIGDVRYRQKKVMSDYITLDDSLLAKASCWSQEKETRMLIFSKEGEKYNPYVSIPGFRIKAIYMGSRIESDYKKEVKKIAVKRSIDLFQIKYDNADITKLIAEKLVSFNCVKESI